MSFILTALRITFSFGNYFYAFLRNKIHKNMCSYDCPFNCCLECRRTPWSIKFNLTTMMNHPPRSLALLSGYRFARRLIYRCSSVSLFPLPLRFQLTVIFNIYANSHNRRIRPNRITIFLFTIRTTNRQSSTINIIIPTPSIPANSEATSSSSSSR